MVTFVSSCVYLTSGKANAPVVHIARNVAWKDFINQLNFLLNDSPQDSLHKEMLLIQKFLKAQETEAKVGVYDLEGFKAIDQARTNCPAKKGEQRSER